MYAIGQIGYALYGLATTRQAELAEAQGSGENQSLPIEYRHPALGGTSSSFAAGTQVVVGIDANGEYITKNIEDIVAGDVVLATDEFNPTATPEYALVTGIRSAEAASTTTITYNVGGNIETVTSTDDHEYFVVGVGWMNAEDLYSGQTLLLPDGTTATVTSKTSTAGTTVYNLTVTDGATYFVADDTGDVDAVVVHNAGRAKRLLKLFGGNSAKGAAIEEAIESGALSTRRLRRNSQIHHIASPEDKVFAPRFDRIFRQAGLNLRTSAFNQTRLVGHAGPHGKFANQVILRQLRNATSGLQPGTIQYRSAVLDELWSLRRAIQNTDFGDLFRASASRIDVLRHF